MASVIFLLTVRVNRDTCVTWPYLIGLTFYCNDIHCILKHNFEGSCSLCGAFDEPQLRGVLIPMETHQLLKSIQVGSHIKVQDGKYAGQTGVILERGVLDGDHVAVILTDSGGREITVRFSHVQESSEIS